MVLDDNQKKIIRKLRKFHNISDQEYEKRVKETLEELAEVSEENR